MFSLVRRSANRLSSHNHLNLVNTHTANSGIAITEVLTIDRNAGVLTLCGVSTIPTWWDVGPRISRLSYIYQLSSNNAVTTLWHQRHQRTKDVTLWREGNKSSTALVTICSGKVNQDHKTRTGNHQHLLWRCKAVLTSSQGVKWATPIINSANDDS